MFKYFTLGVVFGVLLIPLIALKELLRQLRLMLKQDKQIRDSFDGRNKWPSE